MCGIAGITDFSGSSKVNREILKKMSDVIIHRGPDSDGFHISEDNSCGLAFRRLAIIDLSELGNQPMTSVNGRYTIVFNGEIYNHAELRIDLEQKGYKYRSKTDTETILNGFAEYGPSFLDRMLGMWAIAIWDNHERKLFLARDRIGIKPLYFSLQGNRIIFGSEIKSILATGLIKPELNIDELPNFLNFGMTSNQEALFKNIRKIPAAHFAEFSEKDGFQLKRYWSPISKLHNYSEEEIHELTLDYLRRAIKDRMMSDVPFGVFLSGGIDSSVNVALMAELMNRPVDTYTVGFKELEQYNELAYARQIADKFKTNHHEILIDHNDGLEVLEDIVWHTDEPNGDPVCIPLYYLSKLTRDSGTIVVQVGEGSDEQFVGYSWMAREYFFEQSYFNFYRSMPAFLRYSGYYAAKPLLKALNQNLVLDYVRRATEGEELYWSGISRYSPSHQEDLLTGSYQYLTHIPAKYAARLYSDALAQNPDAELMQRMVYLELTNRLAEILLMRVDKIGMAHSIEARVPFLDHRFVEFTMSIPAKTKIPTKQHTKHLLKKAVESILPHNIIYRQKQGFAAPVKEWFRTHWHDYAYSEIFNSRLVREGVFNKAYIEKLFVQHTSGKRKFTDEIYYLLILSLWYKKFID